MSKRTLLIVGVIALVVLLAGPVLMAIFGPQFGYGSGMMGGSYGFGRGMMDGYGGWMHPGYGGWTGGAFAWPMLALGLARVLGWVAQIAIIAVIVAWLLKPRAAQNTTPPQS